MTIIKTVNEQTESYLGYRVNHHGQDCPEIHQYRDILDVLLHPFVPECVLLGLLAGHVFLLDHPDHQDLRISECESYT